MASYRCPRCRTSSTRKDTDSHVCSSCGFEYSVASPTNIQRTEDGGRAVSQTAVPVPRAETRPIPKPGADVPRDLMVPGYHLLSRLGKGGMGEVYLGEQEGLGRQVAIKVLNAELSKSKQLIQRFDREAQALAKLEYPSIVRIINKGRTSNGQLFFSMEYVRGDALRKVLSAGKFTAEQRTRIVLNIADTLAYTHSQGIIHRDIKPENIMILEIGGKLQVKILDFGLAAVVKSGSDDVHLTREGVLLGTPMYMAPEQRLNPKNADHRADIYSLGVVFYELLTDKIPVGAARPPSQVNGQVNPALDAIVARMLEPSPQTRYQLMSELITALRAVLRGDQPVATPVPDLAPPVLNTQPFTTEKSRILVDGRARPRSTVVVQVNAESCTTQASEVGHFSVEVTLKGGQNTIVARATERGRESASSPPVAILLLPEAPELAPIAASTADRRLPVSGRAHPGGLVHILVAGQEYKVTADPQGRFSAECTLDEGSNTLHSFVEVDGLRSREAPVTTVVCPLSTPVLEPLPESTRDSFVEIRGRCAPLAEVVVTVGAFRSMTTSDIDGQFDVEVPLSLGVNPIQAVASRTGVQSAPTAPVPIRRGLPLTPKELACLVGAVIVAGVWALALWLPTIDVKPIAPARTTLVSGQAPANSVVQIFVNDRTAPQETLVGSDGSFRAEITLRFGQNSLRIVARRGQNRVVEKTIQGIGVKPPAPTHLIARRSSGRRVVVTGRVEEGSQVLIVAAQREHPATVAVHPIHGTVHTFQSGPLELAPCANRLQVFAVADRVHSLPAELTVHTPPAPPRIVGYQLGPDGDTAVVRGLLPTAGSRVQFKGRQTREAHSALQLGADGTFEARLPVEIGENRFRYWAIFEDRTELKSEESTLVVTGAPPRPEGLVTTQVRRGSNRVVLYGTARGASLVRVRSGSKLVSEQKPGPGGQFECPLDLAPGRNTFNVSVQIGAVEGQPAPITVPLCPPEPVLDRVDLAADGRSGRLLGRAYPRSIVTMTSARGQRVSTQVALRGTFGSELGLEPGDNDIAMVSSLGGLASEEVSVVVTAPPPPPRVVQTAVTPDRRQALLKARVEMPGVLVMMRRERSAACTGLKPVSDDLFETPVPIPLGPGDNRLFLFSEFKGLRSAEVMAIATGVLTALATPRITVRTIDATRVQLSGSTEPGSVAEIIRGSDRWDVRPDSGGAFTRELELGYGHHLVRVYALKKGVRSTSVVADVLLRPPRPAGLAWVHETGHRGRLAGTAGPALRVEIQAEGKTLAGVTSARDGRFEAMLDLGFGSRALAVTTVIKGASSEASSLKVD
ncbi:MAG: protein kinase, partial [Candidatus Riflebacteria bacterium]|nr:protein kinase [Candidatus Riflebacteria bacterium]